ncbi:MAG TPA: MmgE/PrpD family protein [bacterium]
MGKRVTIARKLAKFVRKKSFDDLSKKAVDELKKRILDSLGCAIGALEGSPVTIVRNHIKEFDKNGICTLIGEGTASPDRAAFYNSLLVRYLDFNDSYLAKKETCHPSDNVAALLSASEYTNTTTKEFLTALAIAYQVQCRLSDAAPVRSKGFDHTTQGSYAVAAGVSRILGLDEERIANAIAISGTAFNALRVTRTGKLSHWKGLAYPNTAFCATHATFLAMHGITGPEQVFEGDKGFMDAIAGRFNIDWAHEDIERVTKTIIKKYNSEIHSQSSVECALEMKRESFTSATDIRRIEIDIFDVAYNIIGGGEEGGKTGVKTKEEADHSLPYIVAVAILDGKVMPEQYLAERILAADVQNLHRKVLVRPRRDFSRRFPEEIPCLIKIHLKDGRVLKKEKRDYEGFFTNPMSWEKAVEKFNSLSDRYIYKDLQKEIVDAVKNLEHLKMSDLINLLKRIPGPQGG